MAIGRLGPVFVEVVLEKNSITEVKVLENGETAELAAAAFDRVPKAILAGQSLGVDTVTGATFSSRAVILAVKNAIEQAGGDPAPLMVRLDKSTPKTETITVDVCVVGAGGGGTSAAVEAARAKRSVLLLEKSVIPGGISAQGAGLAAVNSEYQKAAGIKFTTDDVFEHMYKYSNGTVYAPLLRKILDESATTISWLKNEFGWNFQFITPSIWGKESFDTYHLNTTFGLKRMNPFYEDFTKNGGRLLLETAGEKLIVRDGKVVGVEAKRADGTKVIVNAKAVVLATGGAASNDQLLKEKTGSSEYEQMGYNVNMGDGIRMATEVGAATTNELFIEVAEIGMTPRVAPNTKFNINLIASAALLNVNTQGVRYFNEALFREQPLNVGGGAIASNGAYYVVFDQRTYDSLVSKGFEGLLPSDEAAKQRPQFERLSHFAEVGGVPPMFIGAAHPMRNLPYEMEAALKDGYAWKAGSVEELAKVAKLPRLAETVKRYQGFVEKGKDDDFVKNPLYLTPISNGPFYAVKYLPGFFNTLGGVKVNEKLEALRADNSAIPGLYVAGVDGGSMFHKPYFDICGTTMMYAFTSGRIAGREAVNYVLSK
jgi:fumarate reductase flavoprotein subunit